MNQPVQPDEQRAFDHIDAVLRSELGRLTDRISAASVNQDTKLAALTTIISNLATDVKSLPLTLPFVTTTTYAADQQLLQREKVATEVARVRMEDKVNATAEDLAGVHREQERRAEAMTKERYWRYGMIMTLVLGLITNAIYLLH